MKVGEPRETSGRSGRRWPLPVTSRRTLQRYRGFALGTWFLLLLSCAGVSAQPVKRPMTVDDQFRLAEPGAPLLSPDGQWVLYTVERSVLAENARHSSTWLAPTDGSRPPREFLREGDASPMWAPGSRSVFFLRSHELFEQRVEDTAAVQRSHLGPGPDGTWQLSRDGSFFLVVRPEASASGPGAETDAVFVDEGSNGQTRDYWLNLWRYDLGAAALTRVTHRDWSINSADLSPDGRRAIVAARPDNQRNTRAKTELFVVDLATGASRQLTHNAAPETDPLWSPDGESVVFFAVRLDRWEFGNGDLWRLDVTTGETRNLTPRHKGRFTQAVFSPDGKSLLASSGYGTARFPVRIDVASGRITPLVQ